MVRSTSQPKADMAALAHKTCANAARKSHKSDLLTAIKKGDLKPIAATHHARVASAALAKTPSNLFL